MSNIEKIDFAIISTISKKGSFFEEEYINEALKKLLKENFSRGFTKDNNARYDMEQLSKKQIEKEMLKNVVKKYALMKKLGYRINGNKKISIDRISSVEDADALMYTIIKNNDINHVSYILEKNPNLYNYLISSFINSRYHDKRFINKLDDQKKIDGENKKLLEKLDNLYKNNLESIDFAIESTMNKGGRTKTFKNMFTQLRKYLVKNDPKGFTREKGARNVISSISQENIMKEMLKNIVKVGCINNKRGYDTLFNNNVNYDDPKMNLETVEEYINNLILINQNNIDAVFQTLKEHPVLFNGLISSFICRRYYDLRYREILDNPNSFDDAANKMCENIDSYRYNEVNNNFSK